MLGALPDDRLTPGLLDLGLGRPGEPRRRDLECACDLAVPEDLHRRLPGADEPGLGQPRRVDLLDGRVEPAEVAQVDDGDLRAELIVVEAAVRQLAVEGHLAALEPRADAGAGTGRLALPPPPAGLAVAAALAAANALLAVDRTGYVFQFVEFHG